MSMDIFDDYDDVVVGEFFGPVICEIKKMHYRKLDNEKGSEQANIQLKVIGVREDFDEEKYGLPVGETIFHTLSFPSLSHTDGGRYAKKLWKSFCIAAGIPKEEAIAVFDEEYQDEDHWSGYNVGCAIGAHTYKGKTTQAVIEVFDPTAAPGEPEDEEPDEPKPAPKKKSAAASRRK